MPGATVPAAIKVTGDTTIIKEGSVEGSMYFVWAHTTVSRRITPEWLEAQILLDDDEIVGGAG